mmetsp:Transcript_58127/g.102209  ORF Transcript_58127/g.102209 Transcript_58127/m.102209 type:complete len:328 (+) Transcript_58127:719-1702(+)
MGLLELILVLVAQLDQVAHVNFLEGRQHRSSVLGLFQTLGDALSHAGHLDSGLSALHSARGHHRGSGSSSLRGSSGRLGSLLRSSFRRLRSRGSGLSRSSLGLLRCRSSGRGIARRLDVHDRLANVHFGTLNGVELGDLAGNRRTDLHGHLVGLDHGNNVIHRHNVADLHGPGGNKTRSDGLAHDRHRHSDGGRRSSSLGRGSLGLRSSLLCGGSGLGSSSTLGRGVHLVKRGTHRDFTLSRHQALNESTGLLGADIHGHLVGLHDRDDIILGDSITRLLVPGQEHSGGNRVAETFQVLGHNGKGANVGNCGSRNGSNGDASGGRRH